LPAGYVSGRLLGPDGKPLPQRTCPSFVSTEAVPALSKGDSPTHGIRTNLTLRLRPAILWWQLWLYRTVEGTALRHHLPFPAPGHRDFPPPDSGPTGQHVDTWTLQLSRPNAWASRVFPAKSNGRRTRCHDVALCQLKNEHHPAIDEDRGGRTGPPPGNFTLIGFEGKTTFLARPA